MLDLPRFTATFCYPALNEPSMREKDVRSQTIIVWELQCTQIIYGHHSCLTLELIGLFGFAMFAGCTGSMKEYIVNLHVDGAVCLCSLEISSCPLLRWGKYTR